MLLLTLVAFAVGYGLWVSDDTVTEFISGNKTFQGQPDAMYQTLSGNQLSMTVQTITDNLYVPYYASVCCEEGNLNVPIIPNWITDTTHPKDYGHTQKPAGEIKTFKYTCQGTKCVLGFSTQEIVCPTGTMFSKYYPYYNVFVNGGCRCKNNFWGEFGLSGEISCTDDECPASGVEIGQGDTIEMSVWCTSPTAIPFVEKDVEAAIDITKINVKQNSRYSR